MILDQASCLSFLRCLILGGMAESPPWLICSEKAIRLENLVAALVEEASAVGAASSASAPASVSCSEKQLAVQTLDWAHPEWLSDICKLAADATHGDLQSYCANFYKSCFGLENVLQVRRTIVKRLLRDVDDEIAAKVGSGLEKAIHLEKLVAALIEEASAVGGGFGGFGSGFGFVFRETACGSDG